MLQKQTQPQYTKEQLWKLYDNLPPELQEAIFSSENSEQLDAICQRYGVAENQIPETAKLIGRVLLGVLPPEDFPAALEKETGLKKETAKQITHEINRFIFAPVKDYLAQIYHLGVGAAESADTSKLKTQTEKTEAPGINEEASPAVEEKIKTTGETKNDSYREPLK